MNTCQNCGKANTAEAIFCRFCGTKFNFQTPVMANPFDHSAPRPYAWKTDEFRTENEARPTMQFTPNASTSGIVGTQPAPLAFRQNQIAQNFRCPRCTSQFMPRLERRISTAGWVTFAVLLVFFFPLFWIGLLIKEDVPVCQTCNLKLS